MPGLLAASDVLGTGWFAAVSAEVGPGKTVAVVGDGAVGLLGVLAARHLGAERIIAVSRHADRQRLATRYGATAIVTERGDEGVAAVKELTDGLGAHSVIEAVGTQESMMQAIRSTRPGGHVGYVGVSHDVSLPGDELFFSAVHLAGDPAPVRRFLPELIDLIMARPVPPIVATLTAVVVLLVPACSSTSPTSPSPDPSSTPSAEGPRSSLSADPPSGLSSTRDAREPDQTDAGSYGRTTLTVTLGGREFSAEVGGSPPARELLAQLPLQLRFRDHNGLEKVAPLPRPLTTDGVPSSADPEVDDLGYYAPAGELVLYYGDVGSFEGIVRLGRLDPALSALLESGPDEVEVALRVD